MLEPDRNLFHGSYFHPSTSYSLVLLILHRQQTKCGEVTRDIDSAVTSLPE